MKKIIFLILFYISVLQSCTFENVEPVKAKVPAALISYSATIAPINEAQCNSCHVPQGTGNGDFSTYAGVKVKVNNGSMYARVVNMKDMPTPGSGYSLTDVELAQYTAWLQQGAKNN